MPADGQSNDYIVNALQDLGHEVFYCDHRRFLEKCYEVVPAIMKLANIDLMLVLYLVENKTYSKEYIDILKAKFPNVKYAAWIFDTTINGQYCDESDSFVDLMKRYDYFFTVCRGQVESFKKQDVNAYFLPEGFSPYMRNLNFLSYSSKKKYDITFIGQIGSKTVHQERMPLLKSIIDFYSNTRIWGALFDNETEILKHHAQRPTFNDIEHSRIVAESRINLGHSGWSHIDGYFSARNYRIMGTGGFLLANHSKNVEEFFEPDVEAVFYKDNQECLDKIKYYLKNESEREAISKKGILKVLQKHTFNHRLEEMIKIIKE